MAACSFIMSAARLCRLIDTLQWRVWWWSYILGVVYGLIWKHCCKAVIFVVVVVLLFVKLLRKIPVSGWFLLLLLLLLSPSWGRQWETAAWLTESLWSFVLYIHRDCFLHPDCSEGWDSRNRHCICGAGRWSIYLHVYRKAIGLCYIPEHACPAKHWSPQPPRYVTLKPLEHIVFLLCRDFSKRIKTLLCIIWKETLFPLK